MPEYYNFTYVPVDAHNYEDDDVYEIEEKETE
jgi:hypothetical protein